MIHLTHDQIDYAALTESVRSHDSGAVVLFLGTVRELTSGRRTVALDYDAYGPMAEAKLQDLEAEARRRWPVDQVAIVHRIGHLELGDVSVAVAVSCPHRHDAFEAARFLIDTLKVTVPIWKKENWSDGTTEWVHPDGAPTAENKVAPVRPLDLRNVSLPAAPK
jgi:molybdopterin synthase catalytic subunit